MYFIGFECQVERFLVHVSDHQYIATIGVDCDGGDETAGFFEIRAKLSFHGKPINQELGAS